MDARSDTGTLETVSANRAFGGVQTVYRHRSAATGCDMTFAVYTPPGAEDGGVPLLWYLSGLTCTHENAMTKGGFQEACADWGIAVIFPDTSPRGAGVADDEAYDLGQGAGFYVDALREPWAPHFRMRDYVTRELRGIAEDALGFTASHGITGHSMGGHGALTLAMGEPDLYDSLSAFAPIANPTQSDWGRKQFAAYLGEDEAGWARHDATLLVEAEGWKSDILVDQGTGDQFLALLRPEALAGALTRARVPCSFRMQSGYDHSYFFVSTFAAEHVAWHAERLMK